MVVHLSSVKAVCYQYNSTSTILFPIWHMGKRYTDSKW